MQRSLQSILTVFLGVTLAGPTALAETVDRFGDHSYRNGPGAEKAPWKWATLRKPGLTARPVLIFSILSPC